MTNKVRLRFAPSPTGNPHIGNVRTAIFAWLFARKHGGDYMIRVEDTDQGRRTDGAVESMLESLKWVGLDWDEGPDVKGPHDPYIQSQRLSFYEKAAEDLIASGHAYRCYCSPERLNELRRIQQERGDETIGYDRHCLNLTDSERRERENSGAPFVVRFRMPDEGKSTLDDIIFGHLEFENRLYDDFVALKSDGFPTYHLASVVDDHLMGITHVTRGKEWLSSVPRHVQLYSAFGWDMPEFAHMPMILAPDKTKLSKRHGAASVMDYRDMGVLPEALMNYLALLGWSLDDHSEIFTADELISSFELERVSKSDAVFDRAKLDWLNGQHIRLSYESDLKDDIVEYWQTYMNTIGAEVAQKMDEQMQQWRVEVEKAQSVLPISEEWKQKMDEQMQQWRVEVEKAQSVLPISEAWKQARDIEMQNWKSKMEEAQIVPLVRERLKTLQDAAPLVKFLFSEQVPLEPGQLVQRGMDAEGTVLALREARGGLADLDGFDTQAIEDLLRPMAKDLDIKVGQLLGSLRAAVTGQKVSPPLFESLEALGRETTISRIEDAIAALENSEPGD